MADADKPPLADAVDDAVAKLTLGDLLVWGRYWQQHNETAPHAGEQFHLGHSFLRRYLAAANAALEQELQEAARKKPRSRGGRPPGGMGEQKLRLVAAGVREDDADLIVGRAFGKPPEAVRRASATARKKPSR